MLRLRSWIKNNENELLVGVIGLFSWVAYYYSISLGGYDMLRMPKLLWALAITFYILLLIVIEILSFIFQKRKPPSEEPYT